jgi:SAM-dependent methyltransferase
MAELIRKEWENSVTTPRREGGTTGQYAHGHHESVLRSHRRRTAQNSAGYLLPRLRAGMSILDVGCGPGTITADFAQLVAPGRVVGMDADAGVIDQAIALGSPATFIVGDAYDLPFTEDEFDVVHAHQVLQHLARPVDALREWRRVGHVVAVREFDYGGIVVYPFSDGLRAWADLYPRVHRSSVGEPNAGRRLKQWAREAGFTGATVGGSLWVFESAQDRAWWGGMWEERAVASSFALTAISQGLATLDDLNAISNAWRTWASDPDGWLCMPHAELVGR